MEILYNFDKCRSIQLEKGFNFDASRTPELKKALLHFVPNYITNCGDLPRKSLQTLKKHQKLGKNDDEISCPTHWFLVSKNPILQTRSITKSNPMHQVWLFYYSTMFSYQQLPTSATIQKSFSDFVYFLFLNWADLTGQKNSQIKSYKYLTFLLHSWCSQICSLSDFESRIFQPDSYYEGGGPIETSM